MYITNFNLNQLIQKVEVQPSELLSLPQFQHIFSLTDYEYLTQNHKFFSCHDKMVLTYLKEVRTKPDTYTLLWEGLSPAYHINKNCQKLKSDYKNFRIPATIAGKEDEVIKFRNYIRAHFPNIEDLETDSAIIELQAKFGFSDTQLVYTHRKNSGTREIDFSTLSIEELRQHINTSLYNLENFSSQSPEHRKIFQLIYRTPEDIVKLTRNHAPNIVLVATELSKQKNGLILAQIALLQKELNFDQENLSGDLLEEHGFKPCSCVKKHKLSETIKSIKIGR